MNTNLGVADRIIRFVVMLVLFVVGSLYVEGWIRIALYILALAMTITFTTGYCFIYKLVGVSTARKNNKKNK